MLVAGVISCCGLAIAQATVEAEVRVKHLGNAKGDNENVLIWLSPLDKPAAELPAKPGTYRMVQKNKEFHPHVLAVPVGTAVLFPNEDPFFHNVFSLYKGKRFDLGLYEAGSTRKVVFDKPGVSFIFCNIHPEMSAYVLAVNSPFFELSDRSGQVNIADVPYGKYRVEVWYERAESTDLAELSRVIDVQNPVVKLGVISLADSPRFQPKHLNKHGKPYDPDATTPY
jgi:plastocyanin